jgi:hypothetical protein
MPQPCAITTCKRTSRALCYCCQQELCLQHLKEHNDLLIAQLNPLVDKIDNVSNRLKSINIEKTVDDCRQKLEQWRVDCHKKIDDFFEQKYQEIYQPLTEKMEKRREEIDQIQSKVAALLHQEEVTRQDINLLTATIRNLDKEVSKIEHTAFNTTILPLVLDNLVHIEEWNTSRFDLPKMLPVCKTINYTDKSSVSLASNDRFLLMHQMPSLCLVDLNLEIVRQTTWNYGEYRDMCWSSSLDRFIIVGEKGIFSVDEKTMLIDKLSVGQERNWLSCTSSDTSLFLSTYTLASSIIEYSLLPSVKIITEWKSPDTCQKQEWITDMKYNNGTIALLIHNTSQKQLFIELRNVKTLSRLWSIRMDSANLQKKSFHCCLLNDDEWLVMKHDSDRLVHVTKDGKMKSSCSYESTPWCATMFGSDIIVITTTQSINFHKC